MRPLELPLELPLLEPLPPAAEEEQPKPAKNQDFEVDYTVKVFEIILR